MPGDCRPMAQSQQFQPGHQEVNRVLKAKGGDLTRGQLDREWYPIQLSAYVRDEWRLLRR